MRSIKAKDLKIGQRIAWGGDVKAAGTVIKITRDDVHVRWDDKAVEPGIYGRDDSPVSVID